MKWIYEEIRAAEEVVDREKSAQINKRKNRHGQRDFLPISRPARFTFFPFVKIRGETERRQEDV